MYAELQMTRTNPNSLSELLSCATATVCEQILLEIHCGQFKPQTYWPFPFDWTMWGVSLRYEVTARIRLSVPCASVIILLPCSCETTLFRIPCKLTSGMVLIPFSSAVISRHKNDSTRFLTGVTVGSGWMLSLERLRGMAVYSLSAFIAEADRGLMPAARNPQNKCSGRMESENSRDRTYGKICFEIWVAFVAEGWVET